MTDPYSLTFRKPELGNEGVSRVVCFSEGLKK